MKLPSIFSKAPTTLVYLGGALLAGLCLYLLVSSLNLVPPKNLSIAAGSEGSAYYQIAKNYQTILAEDGIKLTIVETAGSIENARILDDIESDVDIALIQGGVANNNSKLNALAAIFPEPLLTFARVDAKLDGNPFSWDGKRIALGAEGSGTRAVISKLSTLTNAPALAIDSNPDIVSLSSSKASQALMSGTLDLAFFVAPLSAPYLQPLYSSPDIELLTLEHGKALASQLSEAHYIELYSGALRYKPAYPEEAIPLITLVAKLVARDDLHPALVNRLVRAAKITHSQRVKLVMSEPFPNTGLLDLHADVYASKLLREGFNPLEKVLPYWVVAQINRFAILLLPIIFLLLPLFKILPAILAWRMQSRVYRYYNQLHEIDLRLSTREDNPLNEEEQKNLLKELGDIEIQLRSESLPLKYRESAYTAVQHVQLVRSRLQKG